MKKLFYCAVFAILVSATMAQTTTDIVSLRGYNFSLLVSLEQELSPIQMGEYGEVISYTGAQKYLFQGQEYESSLGLYLFPYRIYSPIHKRFLQPDPLSQYFSPYLFTGADPVNYVDKDGRVGKPLVLHGLQSRPGTDKVTSAVSEDLMREVDAYYVPLADFVKGDFETPKEWNGNVFIETHGKANGDLISERYSKGEKIRTGRYASSIEEEGRSVDVAVNNRAVGSSLSRLSRETGVPVKSITLSGCEGSQAAKDIANQVSRSSRMFGQPDHVTSRGLKPGNFGMFVSQTDERETYQEAGAAVSDEEIPTQFFVEDEQLRRGGHDFFDAKDGYGVDVRNLKTMRRVPMLKRQQPLSDFMNGRLPPDMSQYFDEYSFGTEALSHLK